MWYRGGTREPLVPRHPRAEGHATSLGPSQLSHFLFQSSQDRSDTPSFPVFPGVHHSSHLCSLCSHHTGLQTFLTQTQPTPAPGLLAGVSPPALLRHPRGSPFTNVRSHLRMAPSHEGFASSIFHRPLAPPAPPPSSLLHFSS